MKRLISLLTAGALFLSPALAQAPPNASSLMVPNGGPSSGGGAVSSVTGGCGVTVNPTTGATVVSGSVAARNNTATTDTLVTGDCGTVVTESNASAVAVAIAQAGSTGFLSGYYVTVKNKGAGLVTITPTTSTIDGAATLTLVQNQSIDLYSDGTNYITLPGKPILPGMVIPNVIGTVTTQSGTTYTFAATDCGTTVRGSNASAQTFTIPQGLPVGCTIAVEQAGAGKVSVNGSAVTPATLHSAHSYTGTSAQWAVIDIFTESSNVAILTGDGA